MAVHRSFQKLPQKGHDPAVRAERMVSPCGSTWRKVRAPAPSRGYAGREAPQMPVTSTLLDQAHHPIDQKL
jgi:hypothetical protein